VVGANDIKQRGLWIALTIGPGAIDGVRGTAPSNLLIIDFALRFTRKGKAQHAEAHFGGRRDLLGLERRLRRRNEEEAVEFEFLASGLRDEQMPDVRRVERTSE